MISNLTIVLGIVVLLNSMGAVAEIMAGMTLIVSGLLFYKLQPIAIDKVDSIDNSNGMQVANHRGQWIYNLQ
jgi:hypothetical protein